MFFFSQLVNDVGNYLKMMGGKVIFKEGVVPHKLECQGRLQPVKENRLVMARNRKNIKKYFKTKKTFLVSLFYGIISYPAHNHTLGL